MLNRKLNFLDKGSLQLDGAPEFYVQYIENNQIKDRALWKKFIEPFVLKSDVKDMGWRCEYWGKMMRGACLIYTYTGDPELYAVLEETVLDMLSVQEENGRFSSYTVEQEFNGWDLWGRKYITTALLHFYEISENEALKSRILSALERHVDYIVERIGDKEGQKAITDTSYIYGGVNSCTILEPVVELYKKTGKESYLEFAKYILSTGGCKDGNLLAYAEENKFAPYQYPVKKAYEVMSFFEGVLAYYEVTGEEKYFKIVNNFVEKLNATEVTLIGSAGGFSEEMNNAAKRQTDRTDKIMQETCVTVTWIRLLFRLYRLTGKRKYIDRIERSTVNALYGSVNTKNIKVYIESADAYGEAFPFDSYSPSYNGKRGREIGGYKEFSDGTHYGCCACIGSAGLAILPLISVVKKGADYVINEYYPFRAKDADFEFSLTGDYLKDGKVDLVIDKTDGKEKRLKLRVPSWCNGFTVRIGNEEIQGRGEYVTIKKAFRTSDKLEIELNYGVRCIELNGLAAFEYGPLVLARDNRKEWYYYSLYEEADFGMPIKEVNIERDQPSEGEIVRFHLKQTNGVWTYLTDYTSCGKNWLDMGSRISVWLNYKK